MYTATRYGGIFPGYWRHYVDIQEISTGEIVMSRFVKSDDIKARDNETYWNGDTIVMTDPNYYSKGKQLQKVVTTYEKAVFYFPEGYATQ